MSRRGVRAGRGSAARRGGTADGREPEQRCQAQDERDSDEYSPEDLVRQARMAKAVLDLLSAA
jgi:hypothetical protein